MDHRGIAKYVGVVANIVKAPILLDMRRSNFYTF